jgi:undecaprenyl diphosphate synthase
VNAVKTIAEKVKSQLLSPENINEDILSSHLCTHPMPDPELLIRTSGEKRISNFLLWQIAYTELYFCDKLWPEFKKEDFYNAVHDYQNRERRFGKTSQQLPSSTLNP